MKTDTRRAIEREPAFSFLTDREIQCLQLVAEGKRLDDAANVLIMSREEVDMMLLSAQAKLEASNLMHAVSLAMLIGLIDHSDPHQPK
ncbi:DNA-binding CsgD family transcriptional regulator [Peteryoungia aggregata LMG 23059]|uniref:DNA-binding CsgD family transcriptional regulator n=1 Tax=Peteryoungia aggregata LMG 23059 TaxID=1368425 RepID=A0ABU0G4Y5_9HYPH|nr:helix-turn-helix transcriptional regulator [Peteryoungia aggregata]MDQ0420386.1 DNA-binding CsgD family transcriptional regulator [Peteryoungia aggregata LMG 23059]